ncbi:hypothetical protein AB4Y42_40760 [Paraburkholderia sp. EG286B]|uniref:hypothetical protein n=1 Tax=Paraburkholderia sp. EG286B TaxID=3237011 RepID=UPI0034D261C6
MGDKISKDCLHRKQQFPGQLGVQPGSSISREAILLGGNEIAGDAQVIVGKTQTTTFVDNRKHRVLLLAWL